MKRISIGVVLAISCMVAAALGAGFAIYLKPAEASRNSSGTYSPTSGIPVVAGTVIAAPTFNNLISDIGTTLTDSLDRNGKGGMLAALRCVDGTKALPQYSFTNENSSGLYRAGTNDVRMSVNATDVTAWNASGITSAPLVITGTGQTAAAVSTSSSLGGALALSDTGSSVGNGGMIVFGASQGRFAAIKGFLQDGANNTRGDIVFATRVIATDSTLTEQMRIALGSTQNIKFSGGIMNDGAGFKHRRFGSTCGTAASSGSSCTTVLTWGTAFADTSYTPVCWGSGPGGLPGLSINTVAAASVTINVVAYSAAIASYTGVDCVAIHD